MLMPMCLLSTVIPRYGHLTTVEEVAYLGAMVQWVQMLNTGITELGYTSFV